MTPEEWAELEPLLQDALDLEPSAREALLRGIDTADPEKGRHLRELVDSAQDGPFEELRGRCWSTAIMIAGGVADHPTGVGHFRLLRPIGVGGMGDVYEAEQLEPVRRRVALKLVRKGLYDHQTIARFEAERQALALLNHPHIAHIFEAGVSEDGRPFLAMEYVEGDPITTYCNAHRLRVDARLRLFLDVCGGVQQAHQKGIIHRDLKPSNILVTQFGEAPVVKIIDFGIAKAVAPGTIGAASLTEVGQFLGTRGYMSPEQADPGNQDIDTQTDVYALGVILYELLVGVRPFQEQVGNDPRQESQRQRDAAEAPSPANRLKREPALFADAAAERATTVPLLRRQIRGDLESIVLKALEVERPRRYASVPEFADDVRRLLANEPVSARAASRVYRARKFARRHRPALAMTAAVATLVVGFGIDRARQLQLTRHERDKAEAINAFLQEMLGSPSPFQGAGKDVTVVDAVGAAVKRIDDSFKGEPDVKASVLDRVGFIYFELGRYPEAKPLLESGLSIRRAVLGPEHVEVADSLEHLGQLAAAVGNLDTSEQYHRDALAMMARVVGTEDRRYAEKVVTLADILEARGKLDEAEPLYVRALSIQRRGGAEPRGVAATLNSLATLQQEKGNYAASEQSFKEALAIHRQVLGPTHPDVATDISNLGVLATEAGDYATAERHQRDALLVRRKTLGDDHPDTWQSLNNLAVALWNEGKYDEAEPLFREALDHRRRAFGDLHPYVASNAGNLGMLLVERGDFTAAGPLLKEALETRLKLYGHDHLNVVISLNNLGVLQGRLEHYEEAERTFREALATTRKLVGEEHADYARGLNLIADVLSQQGRAAEAEPLARQSLTLRERLTTPEGPDIAQSLMTLGNVLVQTGRAAEAEPLLRRAHSIFTNTMRPGHWRVAAVDAAYAECLHRLGRNAEAEPLVRAALPGFSRAFGEQHSRTRRLSALLVDLQQQRGGHVADETIVSAAPAGSSHPPRHK